VLYEMLVGRPAFDGEGVWDTLARGIECEPEWTSLPKNLSPALRTYLERCLQKDSRQRVQAIGDMRLALEGVFDTAVSPTVTPGVAARWRRVVLAGAAAMVAGGAIVGSLTWDSTRQSPARVSRLQMASSGASEVSVGYNDRDLAITPDGSRVVYIGNRGSQIFVRALDTLSPVAVFTGAPVGLFTSPDGQWIGFRDVPGTLKKVALTGGPAVTLATLDGTPSGATWGPDDTIIVASENVATGLQRVSASGGEVEVLTRPDPAQGEADHLWPEMLPGGRAVLFTITALTGGLGAAQVAILDLETGTRQVLLQACCRRMSVIEASPRSAELAPKRRPCGSSAAGSSYRMPRLSANSLKPPPSSIRRLYRSKTGLACPTTGTMPVTNGRTDPLKIEPKPPLGMVTLAESLVSVRLEP
jgi:serine/threonine-protein kinase